MKNTQEIIKKLDQIFNLVDCYYWHDNEEPWICSDFQEEDEEKIKKIINEIKQLI